MGTYGATGTWGTSQWWRDTSAQWIWNAPGAAQYAPSYISIPFYGTCTVAVSTPVYVYVMADDQVSLYMNNLLLGFSSTYGWANGPSTIYTTTLNAGSNVVYALAQNTGGAAGLLISVSAVSNGNVICHTDSTWTIPNGTLCGKPSNVIQWPSFAMHLCASSYIILFMSIWKYCGCADECLYLFTH